MGQRKIKERIVNHMTKFDNHKIIWIDSIDSTNNEVKRNIDTFDNLSVLATYEQTSGRGQRGNIWLAETGMNLTFSIVIKYEQMQVRLKAADQFDISEITALSVIELLSENEIEAKIKWPNDIYVGDKKICGILIEHSSRGERLSYSIIGVGLNVNQVVFESSLPNPTSMCQCIPTPVSHLNLDLLLVRFMDIFYGYLQTILSGDCVRDSYLSKLWRFGEISKFCTYDMQGAHEFTGRICGLTETGKILIEDCDTHTLMDFGFKEVGYII